MKGLTGLCLGATHGIRQGGLALLSTLTNLQTLNLLSNPRRSFDEDVETIASLPRLTSLRLGNSPRLNPDLLTAISAKYQCIWDAMQPAAAAVAAIAGGSVAGSSSSRRASWANSSSSPIAAGGGGGAGAAAAVGAAAAAIGSPQSSAKMAGPHQLQATSPGATPTAATAAGGGASCATAATPGLQQLTVALPNILFDQSQSLATIISQLKALWQLRGLTRLAVVGLVGSREGNWVGPKLPLGVQMGVTGLQRLRELEAGWAVDVEVLANLTGLTGEVGR